MYNSTGHLTATQLPFHCTVLSAQVQDLEVQKGSLWQRLCISACHFCVINCEAMYSVLKKNFLLVTMKSTQLKASSNSVVAGNSPSSKTSFSSRLYRYRTEIQTHKGYTYRSTNVYCENIQSSFSLTFYNNATCEASCSERRFDYNSEQISLCS